MGRANPHHQQLAPRHKRHHLCGPSRLLANGTFLRWSRYSLRLADVLRLDLLPTTVPGDLTSYGEPRLSYGLCSLPCVESTNLVHMPIARRRQIVDIRLRSMANRQRTLRCGQSGSQHFCCILPGHIVGFPALFLNVSDRLSPTLVRDLPKLIKSENEVRQGIRSPEEHSKLDQYERAQLYNMCNITGSALVVITYAVSVGIAHAIGYGSPATLIHSYNVLLGYFGAITVICTLPFLIIQRVSPRQDFDNPELTIRLSTDPVSSSLRAPRTSRPVPSKSGPP